MRVLLLALVSSLSMSLCERRNVQYCSDSYPDCPQGQYCAQAPGESGGTCEDKLDMGPCMSSLDCPAERPICGSSGACRSCAEGEDGLCQARDRQTPSCVMGRCASCKPGLMSPQSAQCAAATPICEGTGCRACVLHSECQSGVCAKDDLSAGLGLPKGSCVPSEQVLRVDPLDVCNDMGVGMYCTPAAAIKRMDKDHRYLMIRRGGPGMEKAFSELDFGADVKQINMPLYVIGPQADSTPVAQDQPASVRIGGDPTLRGFRVREKVQLTIEGFYVQGALAGVECVGSPVDQAATQLRIQRSIVAENRTGISIKDYCTLDLQQTWIGAMPRRGTFPGASKNVLGVDVRDSDFALVNAVFSENGDAAFAMTGGLRVTDLRAEPRASMVVNSTFFGQVGRNLVLGKAYSDILCNSLPANRLTLVNSLFFHDPKVNPTDGHVTPDCNARFVALGSDDATLTTDGVLTTATEAGFVNLAERDFSLSTMMPDSQVRLRLRTTGKAEFQVAGRTLRAPAVDVAGRPRGTDQVAIGAHEPAR